MKRQGSKLPICSVDFSVVVPVYGGEKTVEALHHRLKAVFGTMQRTFETIFVNDDSPDSSLEVLKRIQSENSNVVVVDLYKNYGQQNALMCGFQFCTGSFVVTMDDDLQTIPEAIPVLFERLQEGFDAVIASYPNKRHSGHRNAASLLIRYVTHKTFRPPRDLKFSSFRLIRREVIEQIKSLRTPFPYISGMLLSVTGKIVNVDVDHHPRAFGRSGYTLRRLIRLSYNLLINYTSLPLTVMSYSGLAVALIAFSVGIAFVIRRLSLGQVPAGWTSLVVLLSFFFGLLFVMLFVLGEYISRLLREVSMEKQYAIREVVK